MRQSGWLPLLLGLGLGLAGGLFYSWIVNPVEYVETAPGALRGGFRSDYLALVAAARPSAAPPAPPGPAQPDPHAHPNAGTQRHPRRALPAGGARARVRPAAGGTAHSGAGER